MLDYISWYLVELERKLRNRRSSQAVADLIVETRAHLEENASELIAKGLDRSSATKAAVADFGDPDSVVRTYAGAFGVPMGARWFWIILASLLFSLPLVNSIFFSIDERIIGPTLMLALFLAPFAAIPIVFALSVRTRRWVGLPIAGLVISVGLVCSLWITASIGIMTIQGTSKFFYMPTRKRQIEDREAWLARLDQDFSKLQTWRANRNSLLGDQALLALCANRGEYRAPVPVWSEDSRSLPSDTPENTNPKMWSYLNQTGVGARLQNWPDFKSAREVWIQNGDKYAVMLKSVRADMTLEIATIRAIRPTPWSERWSLIGHYPIMMAGFISLVALLMNGLTIFLLDLHTRHRRTRWRRQIG